jgi:hypothetical protein
MLIGLTQTFRNRAACTTRKNNCRGMLTWCRRTDVQDWTASCRWSRGPGRHGVSPAALKDFLAANSGEPVTWIPVELLLNCVTPRTSLGCNQHFTKLVANCLLMSSLPLEFELWFYSRGPLRIRDAVVQYRTVQQNIL